MRAIGRGLGTALLLALVSGCASWPEPGTVEAGSVSRPPADGPSPDAAPAVETGSGTGPVRAPAPGSAEPAPVAPAYHPAGQALIDQARRQAEAGETAGAGATLERALRVDPDNPWIWIELSRVRHAEGDRAGARSMAEKALSLAGRDPSAAAEARRLAGGGAP